MFKLLSLALLFVLSVATIPRTAQSAVWETTQEWTPQWEDAYHTWVQTKWDKNFFHQPGFFSELPMDCADAVYSMRFIFAAQNGLPFAMHDPSGGKSIISNNMRRWDKQAPESRKRSFMKFMFDLSDTTTLPGDTYPVAISRDTIGAGRLLMTDHKNHHSWTVKTLLSEGIPYLLFSSRPARTTLYTRVEFPTVPFLFPNGLRPETNAGFRAFRYASDLNKPAWQVPGYSTEQYEVPYNSWSSQMQKRLALRNESLEQRLARILDNACLGIKERVEMVNRAAVLNKTLGRRCMSAEQFDDYSTPSRDQRLKGSLQDLASSYSRAGRDRGSLSAKIVNQVESVIQGDAAAGRDAYCRIEVLKGTQLTLGQVYARMDSMSSSPHDTIAMRWGLEAAPSSKGRACGDAVASSAGQPLNNDADDSNVTSRRAETTDEDDGRDSRSDDAVEPTTSGRRGNQRTRRDRDDNIFGGFGRGLGDWFR